jgi:outer membrane protein assembly factor BamE
MKRLTLIVLAFMIVGGCSNPLLKTPEISESLETSENTKFKMPNLPKFSMPSWLDFSMPSIDVYKPSIMQGSVLEIESVEKLQLGMSKSAVMNLIGSPSINDPFHQYQWDYIHHSIINGEHVTHYRLRLIFDRDALAEIDKSELGGLIDNQ